MPHAYPSHVCACFVSTYPPRQCGMATFTADLCQALGQGQDDTPPGVMALTNTANEYQYPPEVVFEISRINCGIIAWPQNISICPVWT
jgi:hypothetical protein